MSTTRLTFSTKTPTKSFFTLMELIAVISITAILLTITMRIMKTDATKANAQVIGSSLSYAQAYAMSNTTYVMIEFEDTNGDSIEDKITIKEAFDNSGTIEEIVSSPIKQENKLIAGTTFSSSPSTIYLAPTGEPIASDKSIKSASQTFTLQDTRNTSVTAPVTLKPFTGKVTYY